MKTGNRSVSNALLIFATLVASDAGRVGESGTGAMWIAPELVRAPAQVATACSQATRSNSREIVFERIGQGDDASVRRSTSREVVRFEWRPETGELLYDTAAPTSLFDDLVSTRLLATTSCAWR